MIAASRGDETPADWASAVGASSPRRLHRRTLQSLQLLSAHHKVDNIEPRGSQTMMGGAVRLAHSATHTSNSTIASAGVAASFAAFGISQLHRLRTPGQANPDVRAAPRRCDPRRARK